MITSPGKQEIVCILGMHRSGTSALTRVLNLAGVDLGASDLLTTEPRASNPKGYWELHELTAISDAILKRHGGSWDQPPLLPNGWETDTALDDLRVRAQELIKKQFAASPIWGWKDPRTCLTLPFWQQLLPNMRYLICLRNPVDVARSLEHRDGLSAEHSSKLWLTYVASALSHTEGRSRLIIFYEDLMDDCLRELRRLGEFLGKAELAQQAKVQTGVQQFIEQGLQHYRTTVMQAATNPAINLQARSLYLAQWISATFGRKDRNEQTALTDELCQALACLSPEGMPSLSQTDTPVTQTEQPLKLLSAQLDERDALVQQLSKQILEQARALQMQTVATEERIRGLVAQLQMTQTQLQRAKYPFAWRLLNHFKRLTQSRG
jgi:hypothetical protein